MQSKNRVFEKILTFLESQPSHISNLQASNSTRSTTLATHLEIASHSENRRKGLLGRAQLPKGQGLWIKPCEAVHTLGMRFPIDLIFLNKAGKIKKLRRNVGPWRISACLTAHSVLELPAGTIADTHTQVGDYVAFSPLSDLHSTIPGNEKLNLLLVEVQ